jgi:hypothetical protein
MCNPQQKTLNVLNACSIKNRVLNFTYSKNVQKNATLIIIHDTTFTDHTRARMWKFMNSGTENGLYDI